MFLLNDTAVTQLPSLSRFIRTRITVSSARRKVLPPVILSMGTCYIPVRWRSI